MNAYERAAGRGLIYIVEVFAGDRAQRAHDRLRAAGCLGSAEWGRRLAIRVAQLKILRWIAMTVGSMVLILPISLDDDPEGDGMPPKPRSGLRAAVVLPLPMPLSEFARYSA